MKQIFIQRLVAILLVFLPVIAQSAEVEVLGKHLRPDGSIYDFKIHDGDALSPGDRFQIVIRAASRTYYAVIYYSREGEATQLFPPAGAKGSIAAGKQRSLPASDNYFTLDSNGGRELMFIVTAANPLGNIKSTMRGSEQLGNSAEEILRYLNTRLGKVAKLEIINTGSKVTGLTDRVSSGLVKDISRTYAANPWPESYSGATDSRQRKRRAGDTSIPEAVRKRAQEVRALLRRPRGTPSSSSLRTIAVPAPSAPAVATPIPADLDGKTGTIHRDSQMASIQIEQAEAKRVAENAKQLEAQRAAADKTAAESEARRVEEDKRLAAERLEAEKAAAEVKRLEEQQLAGQRAAEERLRQEELAEAERAEAQRKQLERERIAAAQVAERARWLEQQRLEAEKAASEAKFQEDKRLELAKAEAAAKQLWEQQLAAQQAAEEIQRLEAQQEQTRIAAQEKHLLEQQAEEARREAEEQRLQAERVVAAEAAAEVARLEAEQAVAEAERIAVEQATAEAMRRAEAQEERRLAEQEAAEAESAAIAQAEAEAQSRAQAEDRRLAEQQRQEAERIAAAQAATAAERQQVEQQQIASAPIEKPQAQAETTEPEKDEGFFGAIASFLGSDKETPGYSDDEVDVVVKEGESNLQQSPDPNSQLRDEEPAAPVEAVVVLQAPVRPLPPKLSSPAPVRDDKPATKALSAEEARPLYDQVAASIVSVNSSKNAQAAGFIIDNQGHVLTSWHAVNGVKTVDIRFIAVSGAPRSFKASVVRMDKFRDLALLKLDNPPEGIQPITLASGKLPDAGTTVRVFGQKAGEIWATDDAVITRIAQNFTWFSTDNVIHRGEVLQIDLPSSGKGIGELVTSMDYKMLGIKSFSGKETGRAYAVSVRTILSFLQPAKAAGK